MDRAREKGWMDGCMDGDKPSKTPPQKKPDLFFWLRQLDRHLTKKALSNVFFAKFFWVIWKRKQRLSLSLDKLERAAQGTHDFCALFLGDFP